MQLVEAGKLDLDQDVNTYLDFEIPDTFPEPITLRNILTHTAGFEDQGNGLFKIDETLVSSLETYVKDNQPARVFPPGKIGAYSNYGSALSGYIIERVSGMPFEDYIAKNILQPLEMNHSTFEQPLPPSLINDMAEGYNYVNAEYIKASFEFVVGSPAGALSATGLDMANFMVAHLQDGRFKDTQILSPETTQQMHRPLYRPAPQLDGMAHGFFFSSKNGQYSISHGGDTSLFHTNLTLLPESNLGFYISTNGTMGAVVVEDFVGAFLNRYFPPVDSAPLMPTADFAERAPLYAGSYFIARSNFTTLEKTMSLMSTVTVSTTEDRVLVQFGNELIPYVEVEPGLLVNPDDPSDKLALKTDGGQITLSPPLPFVFIKMPWYRTLPVHALILVGGAILFLIAIIAWLVDFVRGLIKREKRPVLARLARMSAGLFGVLYLFFLASFGAVFTNTNPAFGVPDVFFGMPANFDQLLLIPTLIAILGLLMLVFTLIAWTTHFWTGKSRFFYSVLSVFGLAIIWSLYFWNLLL
jgi:CubicO group peptidase (beta-lactamase class C family)